ncbi:aldolase [Mesobacillus subterraneus]|uniref:aldolase n=1 Tax=Mesobacillus subterraneus TaxID=285983 RepID=UPI00203D5CDA|nr:aldolase [Mesobacillus subterraneus]MCM3574677.1 aldolase [Mesobacillus subterraneus]
MKLTINKYSYKAFGLNILSDVQFPDLCEVHLDNKQLDLEIKIYNLSQYSSSLDKTPLMFLTQGKEFYFKVPGASIFCVKNGNEILVSPFDGYDLDELRLYILGTCMGAILFQRKILPLHGSALSINGKVYAFIGDSGAGKSTLATSLARKGYKLLTDDVIAVTLSPENQPIVTPSYPQQKLWEESLNKFGMSNTSFNPIYKREKKFTVPIKSMFCEQELQLAGVFELVKCEDHSVSIKEIHNLERLHTLLRHTYRNFLLGDFGLVEWHFQICSKFVSKIKMFQISRPDTGFTVDEITEGILKIIEKEG